MWFCLWFSSCCCQARVRQRNRSQSWLTWNMALAASSTDLWVGLHFARSPSGIHYNLNDALGADACLMRWCVCVCVCVCVSLSCGVERAESCNHSHTHLFWLEAVCAAADRMRAQGERCSSAHDKRVCRRSLSRAAREGEREVGRRTNTVKIINLEFH